MFLQNFFKDFSKIDNDRRDCWARVEDSSKSKLSPLMFDGKKSIMIEFRFQKNANMIVSNYFLGVS